MAHRRTRAFCVAFLCLATLAVTLPLFAQAVTVEYTDMSHAVSGNFGPFIDTLAKGSGGGLVASSTYHVIWSISPGSASVLAGRVGYQGYVDGPVATAEFNFPRGLAYDHSGNLFVADQSNHVIRKIAGGVVSTFAGLGQTSGFVDGAGSNARFNSPGGLVIDANDNIYVADVGNSAIRRITPDGTVTTIAGNGTQWTFADGTGSAARFYQPWKIALGGDGNIYVSDDYTIRRVTPAGVVTTVVGSPGASGSTDGNGTAARLGGTGSLTAGAGGVLYFGDSNNHELRMISSGFAVTTIAGSTSYYNGFLPGTGGYARMGNVGSVLWDGAALQIADYSYTGGPTSEVLWHSESTLPDIVTIDQNPAPVPQPRQLDLSPQTATSWHWTMVSKPSVSAATLDSTLRNPIFTPDTGGTYRLMCRAANDTGSASITWLDFVATCPSLPVPTITRTSGNNPTCPAGSITLQASDGYPSYSWSNGATTQSITVSPTTTSGYNVTGIDANGCRTSPSFSYTQNVYSQPSPSSISSYDNPAWICTGATGLTVTATQWNSSLWSPYLTWGYRTVSGGAVTSIPGTSGPMYTIKGSDFPGGGTYYLVCINTPPCGFAQTISNQLPVNVEGPPTVNVSASANSACWNANVTLTAAVSNLPNRQYMTYYVDWYRTSTNYVVTECQNNPTCTATVQPGDGFYAQVNDGVCTIRSQTITITQLPKPAPTFNYGATCDGVTARVTNPDPNSTYVWSNGVIGTTMTPPTSGYYSVAETNSSGCSAGSASQYITQSFPATPSIAASGPTTFCQNGSVTLTATSGFSSYAWSNGATTRSIVVTASGNYSVSTTDTAGCVKNSTAVAVTVNPSPHATISANGATTFCAGGNVTLTASLASSYLWSNGATTQSIVVSAGGNYSVTVTDANGCSATSDPTTVTVFTLPAPTIGASGPTAFCAGGSVTLTASSASSYVWSNGATTPAITVNASGNYSVTVTDSNGCSATSAATGVVVDAPVAPVISFNVPSFCSETDVVATVPAGYSSYTWSASAGIMTSGQGTNSFTISKPGSDDLTVSVIVSDANGCSATSTATLPARNFPKPTVTVDATRTCLNGVVHAMATDGPYTGYSWSVNNGTIISGTGTSEISFSPNGPGLMTVDLTVNGTDRCSAFADEVSVAVDVPDTTITASGPTTFCAGGSVMLTVPSAAGYLWSNGATTQSITVNANGNYSVTVTDANGCSATSTTTGVTVNPLPMPAITASGPTTFCAGGSVTLTASVASSYQWSNGATTQAITVNASGNYSVTIADANGCSATSAATAVTVNPVSTPTIGVSGPTTFCAGGSVTLTASSASSYHWSNGATTQAITVNASGNYSVTVTDTNGCSATSAATAVTVNPLPTPTISASGAATFCAGGNVMLTASSASSYLWSNGATTQAITVSASGSYSVTVTDANGCSATSSATAVTVNPLPTPTISASGATTFCAGGSVTLTASAASSYHWHNDATTQAITVSASGNYSVTVTDANGCSATSSATAVTVNPLPTPTISASGATTFCTGGNVTLTASSASSYHWSNGATTQTITVSASGNYSVTVTDANGCSATSSATAVTVNPLPTPTISASGATTFCVGGSVTLTASAASTYLWSNGARTQSTTVNASGSYSVTVTANGCSATSPATTVTVNPLPDATITAPSAICSGTTGAASVATVSGGGYVWSISGGSITGGSGTNAITFTSTGSNVSLSATVTDSKGCAASGSTNVAVNGNPATPSITAGGPTTFCQGGSVTLTAPAAASYHWSDGETTQTIVVSSSGSFTVTVTNASGCTSARSAPVTVTVNPATTITQQPASISITKNTTTTLSVTATGTGTLSYQWYNPPTANNNDTSKKVGTNSPTFTTPKLGAGVHYYYVVVTGTCGTVRSAIATVTAN